MKKNIPAIVFVISLSVFTSLKSKAQAINVSDSIALVNLYDSTDGPHWLNRANWRTSAPLATWYGIRINDFGDVGTVNLTANNLTGGIPLSLGNFALLDTLQLNNNHLSGSLPMQLGYLGWLSVLNLDSNQLTGTIPTNLGSNRLRAVILSNNQLSGRIPASLAGSQLNILALNNNHLSGEVPSAILSEFNTGSLGFLYLQHNYFTFTGAEPVAAKNIGTRVYAPQDTIMPLTYANYTLSVTAGGTSSNKTYKWYKDTLLVKTAIGDSTYAVVDGGRYSVTVNSSLATQLTLYSDTINVTVLPTTLTSFTGSLSKNDVQLYWQTATEINAGYYAIERSIDGASFKGMGNVSALGNSTIRQLYNYTDNNAAKLNADILYYRLKMVDKDGRFAYSNTIKIKLADASTSLSVYPNPVRSKAAIAFSAAIAGKYSVDVTDLNGKLIRRLHGVSAIGANNVVVDVSGLAGGTYLITVTNNGNKESLKMVKQ